MSEDKKVSNSLSVAASRERQERREIRIRKRQTRLADAMLNVQLVAMAHHELKKHVFKTEEHLRSIGLTPEQISLVRGWEQAKRNTPFALESSSTIATSMLRRENEGGKVTVNVENMNVIKLPEKQDEVIAPVVIDIVPETK